MSEEKKNAKELLAETITELEGILLRMDKSEVLRLAYLAKEFLRMPVNGCACRLDENTWAFYETGRDMEDGKSSHHFTKPLSD